MGEQILSALRGKIGRVLRPMGDRLGEGGRNAPFDGVARPVLASRKDSGCLAVVDPDERVRTYAASGKLPAHAQQG